MSSVRWFVLSLCAFQCARAQDVFLGTQSSWAAPLPGTTLNVKDFGAVGDGSTDDTQHIQDALQAVMDAKSGVGLHFPKGDYVCGQLKLGGVSDSWLTFEEGAQFWMLKDLSSWTKSKKYDPWLSVDDCDHLTITGGTWNGDYDWWAQQVPDEKNEHNTRPITMLFSHMTSFTASYITINNAPAAHMKVGGDTIELFQLTFRAQLPSNNTDGILVGQASNVHVHDVDIRNSDDCLKVMDKVRNILFESSRCTGGHGLTIGGGGDQLDVDGAIWRDIDCLGMSYGARVKWTKKTEGQITNVKFEDIRMTNVGRPISMESDYHGKEKRKKDFPVGSIMYKDITEKWDSTQETGSAGKHFKELGFHCDSKAQCNDLHLRNVSVESAKEWVCEYCGGDMDSSVSPDASEHFTPV